LAASPGVTETAGVTPAGPADVQEEELLLLAVDAQEVAQSQVEVARSQFEVARSQFEAARSRFEAVRSRFVAVRSQFEEADDPHEEADHRLEDKMMGNSHGILYAMLWILCALLRTLKMRGFKLCYSKAMAAIATAHQWLSQVSPHGLFLSSRMLY